jgi:hypothetical protein
MNQIGLFSASMITRGEAFLVKRLQAKGVHIYPVSDQFTMKERLRRAIIDSKSDYVVAGRDSATRKCQTFMQCFERLYGEALEQPQQRRCAQGT